MLPSGECIRKIRYLYTVGLYSTVRKSDCYLCWKIDAHGGYYVKRNKSDPERDQRSTALREKILILDIGKVTQKS